MKDAIGMIAALLCCLGIIFLAGFSVGRMTAPQPQENTVEIIYPATMVVTETDLMTDTVTLKDSTGNLWAFYGVEDWQIGDVASVLMETNNTAEIRDDRILNVRYSAWTLEGE